MELVCTWNTWQSWCYRAANCSAGSRGSVEGGGLQEGHCWINRQNENQTWHDITVSVCVCLLTYVRHWYLWESVPSLSGRRPDLCWQMHWAAGTVGRGPWDGLLSWQLHVAGTEFFPLHRSSRESMCASVSVTTSRSCPRLWLQMTQMWAHSAFIDWNQSN